MQSHSFSPTSNDFTQSKDESMSRSHPNFVVKFNEEMSAFEAQLADLRPAECVYFGVSLKRREEMHFNGLQCMLMEKTVL